MQNVLDEEFFERFCYLDVRLVVWDQVLVPNFIHYLNLVDYQLRTTKSFEILDPQLFSEIEPNE